MAKIGLNNFRYAIATVNENDGSITYGTVKKPGISREIPGFHF